MKKTLLLIGLSLIVLLALGLVLSASQIKSYANVGVGMAAKLGCSSRYMSGFTPREIAADLKSYSDLITLFSLHFDDVARVATASVLGFNEVSARYRAGLGCSLEIGDTQALDYIDVTGDTEKTNLPKIIDHDIQSMLDDVMSQDTNAGLNTRALVVVRGGNVVAENYADGMSYETPHLGWSMGKSITSLLIGHLVMRGELDIAQTRLFPQWQDERAKISLENLLQMSSGLDFDETYLPGSDATHMLFSSHDTSAVARDQGQAYPPGTHFSYSSGTTALLSRLTIQTLGGVRTFYPYLYNEILRPMGMHTLILEPDPSGIFVGSSYVYGSAYDWAKAGLVYLNGGELNNVRLVTSEWIEASKQPNNSTNDAAYGYQVWLNRGEDKLRWPNLPEDTFAMTGNRGQRVMMIPSLNLVIVRLGWSAMPYPTDNRFSTITGPLRVSS